jgi:hypothetical protein
MPLKNLYLAIPVGQSVRDFLTLGIVTRLLEFLPQFRIVILTPAYNVPEFVKLCGSHERLMLRRMELPVNVQNPRLRRWRLRTHNRRGIRLALSMEARCLRLPEYLSSTFRDFPPSLVVSTHPRTSYEYEIVMAARRLGVQTLGVVKSWDNVGKGLSSPPHLISVWNPVNKEEALRLLAYCDDEVEINGSPSFDCYYDARYLLPRKEFMLSLGLNPSRPLVTFATGGVMNREYYGRDETHLADDLLRMIGESKLLQGAQLVIRLHPNSRLESFWRFWKRCGVKISFASYLPGIMWCPNDRDLQEQANLLKHSDVIITPASSWVLEAAIFDTPTVVPAYSDLQPEHVAAQLDRWTLVRHFKPLVENNWVPVTRSYQDTLTAIEDALTQPGKYAGGRSAIVDDYVYYRDNQCVRRVAEWIARIADTAQPGHPQGL